MAIYFFNSCELIYKLYLSIYLKVSLDDEIFFDFIHFEKKTFLVKQFRDIYPKDLKNFLTFKKFFHDFLWIFGI